MNPTPFNLPPTQPVLTRPGWLLLWVMSFIIMVGVPISALVLPESSAFHASAYSLTLVGKLFCFALAALALDLVWGYCGILSLGHGLFFSLGGYAMGMYLMRSIGTEGVYHSTLPDFMVFLDWKNLPWFWFGSDHFAWTLVLIIGVPGLLAFVFGFLAFRSRITGVYLSIITQALTYAFMLLFFRNETGFGGNNGFTDFKRILGFAITEPSVRVVLFQLSFISLVLGFLLCRKIIHSRFGKVVKAIRDAESRVRFLGYNPIPYKLAVWTFSAMLCGIAGALYVPQVGIINPSEMSPINSIEMAIWVAVGGRGSLIGAVVGAFSVNLGKTVFTSYFPEFWLLILGVLFILVTRFLPHGLMGIFHKQSS